MSQNKRGPGRPKGSRNKVNIERDVTRALNSGMSLTEIKEFIEDYLAKVAKEGDHKNVVGLIKQDIELVKYLHKLQIDFDKESEEGDESDDDDATGQVISFAKK